MLHDRLMISRRAALIGLGATAATLLARGVAAGDGAALADVAQRFLPLAEERFDILVDRRAWFEPAFRTFWAFCQTPAFRAKAQELSGYDLSGFGTIHFNGA